MSSPRFYAALALALATTTTGCFFTGPGDSGAGAGGGGTSTDQDVAQYDALKAQLEKNRKQFLTPGATGLNAFGTRLYWLDTSNGAPTLQSYDTTSGDTINYTFVVGDYMVWNYRQSESMIVHADSSLGNVVFHAYAVDSPNKSLGDLTTDPPSPGINWWAYAPDGDTLYYVLTEGMTTLMKWTPGDASPTMLFNLEDLGVKVGEFQDFGVSSGIMVFIESGRVWSLDIAAKTVVPLGNMTESQGASIMSDGVLMSTATGPFFYSYQTKMLRDIASDIAHSGYQLNSTYASAHLFDNGDVTSQNLGFTNYQHIVGYLGDSGLFTFDMDKGTVAPLLLNARDNSTVYTSPVFLDDGSVFVQGLQSSDGAIGFDGPVYELTTKL
jgi:hypothetical protein